MMSSNVILVNESDEEIGSMEKLRAHQEGRLHRAFSVFIFNEKKDLLIHKRAIDKYHSAGLWTNTCCSHPMPGEDLEVAANRRLHEEMGMKCKLTNGFHFIYRAELDNDLVEHELDHVFIGFSESSPQPDPEEVSDWRWISNHQLNAEMSTDPGIFTVWFRLAYQRVFDLLPEMINH